MHNEHFVFSRGYRAIFTDTNVSACSSQVRLKHTDKRKTKVM